MSQPPFYPTEANHFTCGDDKLCVEISDRSNDCSWRLIVNGQPSSPTSDFHGILTHLGYGLVSDYFADDVLQAFVPFRLSFAEPATQAAKKFYIAEWYPVLVPTDDFDEHADLELNLTPAEAERVEAAHAEFHAVQVLLNQLRKRSTNPED